MTATIFLISDYVSTYEKYLTWDEIALMQRDGIEFESHTSSHMNLIEAASDEELQQQLAGSKAALEGILASKSIILLIRAAHTIQKLWPRQKLPVTAVPSP